MIKTSLQSACSALIHLNSCILVIKHWPGTQRVDSICPQHTWEHINLKMMTITVYNNRNKTPATENIRYRQRRKHIIFAHRAKNSNGNSFFCSFQYEYGHILYAWSALKYTWNHEYSWNWTLAMHENIDTVLSPLNLRTQTFERPPWHNMRCTVLRTIGGKCSHWFLHQSYEEMVNRRCFAKPCICMTSHYFGKELTRQSTIFLLFEMSIEHNWRRMIVIATHV